MEMKNQRDELLSVLEQAFDYMKQYSDFDEIGSEKYMLRERIEVAILSVKGK
jgi:hypothetical protein